MSSVKCPECNLTNWLTALNCKRCGYFLQAAGEGFVAPPSPHESFGHESFGEQSLDDSHQQAAYSSDQEPQQASPPHPQNYQDAAYQNYQSSGYQSQNYQQPNYQYYHPVNLKTGMAIASMVLGILGFVTSIFLIGILFAPIGLILGIIVLIKANKMPDVYGGKGFAIAGIATSGMMVLFVPMIAAIAIPNLLAARRAANEGSAISTLRALSVAEATYMASSYGKCGDVQTLIATKLIDVSLANNEKNGYRFMVVNLPQGGCELLATPISTSSGNRSFYYSTDDRILRGGPKKGLPADKNDFPINAGTLENTYQAPRNASQKSTDY